MTTMVGILLLLAAPSAPVAGEVKLPLRDYLALVESVEARDAERQRAQSHGEPSVAELASQTLEVSLREEDAELGATYEVEVRGAVKRTVALPFSGVAERISVEPLGAAAVLWTAGAAQGSPGSLELVAPVPGRYKVRVAGRLGLDRSSGTERLRLAPMTAAVAELVLSLPADRSWRCARAVVAEDTVEAGRRRLRLALPRGEPAVVEVRRETRAQEPAKAVASAVAVTVVSLDRELARRHDLLLYEVQRGEIGTLTLTLPAGLEPDDLVTDEGPALQWLEGRTLRVERTKKLTGAGYVAVVSRPSSRDAISLDALVPETKVRARYLAYASGIAADFAPEPAESWSRADLTDLPESVQQVAGALGIVAAWRLRPGAAPGLLRVSALPAPKRLDAVVTQRETTSLLTVENTLLYRDRITVEGELPSLEVALPVNATLWSAEVGNVPVRPVEKAGRVLVPLGLASSGPRVVEVVIVQERAIAPGRSTLELALPELALPVLKHDWRLLLPERNRYRYASGSLRPLRDAVAGAADRGSGANVPAGVVGGVVGGLPDAIGVVTGNAGAAELRGNVRDSSGGVIPGAEVRVTDEATGRSLVVATDGRGEFRVAGLAGGSYTVQASLAGFRTAQHRAIRVASGQSRAFTLTLEVATMAETVSVTAEPSYRAISKDEKRVAEQAVQMQQAAQFRDELDSLKQGLVGGVKPLPVKIPEAGKVLRLAGALPPPRVSATLEVKAPKN